MITVQRILSTIAVLFLLVCLAAVRYFESTLFYDPLLAYFDHYTPELALPEVNKLQLFLNVVFRYALNSLFSIGILWFLFKNKEYLKAAMWVYVLALVVLLIAMLFMLDAESGTAKMALFYVRRFLIQPIWLFILVPSFYYLQRKRSF